MKVMNGLTNELIYSRIAWMREGMWFKRLLTKQSMTKFNKSIADIQKKEILLKGARNPKNLSNKIWGKNGGRYWD